MTGATGAAPWAARYIGLPFGDGPGQVNCWTLVVAVYARERGIDLPRYGEISALDLIRVARAMRAGRDDGWRAVAAPDAFDVALMRSARGGAEAVHVGVMTDPHHVLHVEAASGAVRVPIRHFSVAGRILGWRRRE